MVSLLDQFHPKSRRLFPHPILLRHQRQAQQQHPSRRLRSHHPHRFQLHALKLPRKHEFLACPLQAHLRLCLAHGGRLIGHLPALQAALLPGSKIPPQIQEIDNVADNDDDFLPRYAVLHQLRPAQTITKIYGYPDRLGIAGES